MLNFTWKVRSKFDNINTSRINILASEEGTTDENQSGDINLCSTNMDMAMGIQYCEIQEYVKFQKARTEIRLGHRKIKKIKK